MNGVWCTHGTRSHSWSCTAMLRPCKGQETLQHTPEGPWQLWVPPKGVQERHSGRDSPRGPGMETGAPLDVVLLYTAALRLPGPAKSRERRHSHPRSPGNRGNRGRLDKYRDTRGGLGERLVHLQHRMALSLAACKASIKSCKGKRALPQP